MWTPEGLEEMLLPPVLELQRSSAERGQELPTLVLVHPGGGLAGVYARLSFDARRRVIAVSMTWLQKEEDTTTPQLRDVESTASEYLHYLESQGHLDEEKEADHGARGQIAIGGWSYGGVLALEMASQIESRPRDYRGITRVSGVLLIDAIQPVGTYGAPMEDPAFISGQGMLRRSSADSNVSSCYSDSGDDDDDNEEEAKKSWQSYDARKLQSAVDFGGLHALNSYLASMQSHNQAQGCPEIAWFVEQCYKHAMSRLSTYDPSHLSLPDGLRITLYKAGKASPFPRTLPGPARVQRIKRHLCKRNGWTGSGLDTTDFRTFTLANTDHHDIFAPQNVAKLQRFIDETELQGRF